MKPETFAERVAQTAKERKAREEAEAKRRNGDSSDYQPSVFVLYDPSPTPSDSGSSSGGDWGGFDGGSSDGGGSTDSW